MSASDDRGREDKVWAISFALRPGSVKGLRLTATERQILLARVDALRVEVENAPEYQGVLGP